MKRLLLLLTLIALSVPSQSFAQLAPANEMGVTMGSVTLNVKDMAANIKFWTLLGGTHMKIDGVDVMKFPGAFFFLVPGNPPPLGKRLTKEFCACPDDGYDISTINHLGFNVGNYAKFHADFAALGAQIEDLHSAFERSILFSPDGVMLEIASSKKLIGNVGDLQVHTFVESKPPLNREHQIVSFEQSLWYIHFFGSRLLIGNPGGGLGDDVPGGKLRRSETRVHVLPTRGRAVDRIGFEVAHLDTFCKALEAQGIKFDEPYSTTRHKSYANAILTNPWGTTIELTEGLWKF